MKQNQREDAYVPGQCNIGPYEVRKRMRIGYLGLGMMALFVILAELFSIPQIWKLALFAPTVYALSGFVQAKQRFCFLYGYLGLFSISGKRSRVSDDLQMKKDRKRALWLITQVLVGSTGITLLYYLLS